MTYNGWTNPETWHTALVISNEQPLYSWALREAKRFVDRVENEAGYGFKHARPELAGVFEQRFETDDFPEIESHLYRGLLTRGLNRVNWREIADSYLDEASPSAVFEAKRDPST